MPFDTLTWPEREPNPSQWNGKFSIGERQAFAAGIIGVALLSIFVAYSTELFLKSGGHKNNLTAPPPAPALLRPACQELTRLADTSFLVYGMIVADTAEKPSYSDITDPAVVATKADLLATQKELLGVDTQDHFPSGPGAKFYSILNMEWDILHCVSPEQPLHKTRNNSPRKQLAVNTSKHVEIMTLSKK